MFDPEVYRALLACHPLNPFRRPDWRWALATRLAAAGDRVRREWIDGWVRRAARHLKGGRSSGGSTGGRRPAADPAVAAAVALRSRGDAGLLLEVEARVLAGQSYAEVAARCGLDAGTVEAYERLFFAVADDLGARDFVTLTAMPALHTCPLGPDPVTLVKAFAFFGGPHVLDAALHAFGVRTAPPGSEPAPETVRLFGIVADLRRLASGGENALGLLRLLALDTRVGASAAAADHAALHRPLRWSLGDFDAGTRVANEPGAADPSAVDASEVVPSDPPLFRGRPMSDAG